MPYSKDKESWGHFSLVLRKKDTELGSRVKGEELTGMWASPHHPRYKSKAGVRTQFFPFHILTSNREVCT